MFMLKDSDMNDKKSNISILCEDKKNKDNIPHRRVVWDNHSSNNGIPHVKVIWDNRFAKKVDIWINGKITSLN